MREYLPAFVALSVSIMPAVASEDPISPPPSSNLIVIPRVAPPASLIADLAQPPWSEAAIVSGFIEIKDRQMARKPTWVHLAYTDDALWLACRCEGEVAATTRPAVSERDGRVWADDSVEWLLDPADTRRSWFQIVVNKAGTVYDGVKKDASWNCDLSVKTSQDSTGWVVAAKIPFASLGVQAPSPGASWSANLCRNTGGGERSSWSACGGNFTNTERFGLIVFGDDKMKPVRVRHVEPLAMGPNTIAMESLADASFELQLLGPRNVVGEDRKGELATLPGALAMKDDHVRHVTLVLRGPADRALGIATYPMESPQVLDRIECLQSRLAKVKQSLPAFPAAIQEQARPIVEAVAQRLARMLEKLQQGKLYSRSAWQELAEAVGPLELKLNAAHAYAETRGRFADAEFGVGLESSMRKVMIRDFPFEGRFDDHYDLSLARNEHEGLQVVVIPFARDLKNATVTCRRKTGGSEGKPFPGTVAVSLVGHVDVVDDTPYDVNYRGWWPDPLLDFQKACDIGATEQVAFWVDVATSTTTLAGDYVMEIVAQAQGCRPVPIRLNIHVWDFELGRGTHLRNAFTYSEAEVGGFYGKSWNDNLRARYRELILDHRLNIDNLYRRNPPDTHDLTAWAARGMNAFNLKFVGKGTTPKGLADEIGAYIERIRSLGLLDRAYLYGFDEDPGEGFKAMRELYTDVHKRFPGLKTMTTAYDESFGRDTGLREAVDVWVPLTDKYSLVEARRLRAEGRDMWWYICLNPRHPYANWFIEYPAIESRLLTGAMSYKYQVGGFLYYLINHWEPNRKPIDSGPYTKWNPGSCADRRGKTANGDGNLIFPGPTGPLSSIRFENMRDGFEDYEYLFLLRDLLAKATRMPDTPERKAFRLQAQTLLRIPGEVVKTVIDYTLDPDELQTFRRQVAEAIVEGTRLVRGTAKAPASGASR